MPPDYADDLRSKELDDPATHRLTVGQTARLARLKGKTGEGMAEVLRHALDIGLPELERRAGLEVVGDPGPGVRRGGPLVVNADRVLTPADAGRLIACDTSGGDIRLTLPPTADADGLEFEVANAQGTAMVHVFPGDGDTLAAWDPAPVRLAGASVVGFEGVAALKQWVIK